MTESAHKAPRAAERTFERLSLNARIQHAIVIITFTLLVFTGLPVRYHESPWAGWIFWLMGGPGGRAIVHRVAALGLVGVGFYHCLYVLISDRGHADFRAVLPRLQDARDALNHMKYYVGLRPDPPAFGRFSYTEKFEYLAIAWGTIVMASTGVLLWFEVQAMMIFPKWILDVCRVIHGYEAVLAFLAIIIWHLYCVHLNPDVFPLSRVFLDGKLTESQMKHHHPLEYDEIIRQERCGQPQDPKPLSVTQAGKGGADVAEGSGSAAQPSGKGENR